MEEGAGVDSVDCIIRVDCVEDVSEIVRGALRVTLVEVAAPPTREMPLLFVHPRWRETSGHFSPNLTIDKQ